jgi:MFS family permease
LCDAVGVGDVPLDDPAFRRLFVAEAVSMLGTGVAPVALVFAVLSVSDAAGVGLVLAARTLPEVALLLGGGVVADRRSPRTVLVLADAARASTQGLTALLLIAGEAELWHLAALQAAYGAAEAFSGPARSSLIADVVAPERLQAANSLRAFAESIALIAGPALAGVLLVAVGPGWGLAVDAVSFAASALLLASLVAVSPAPRAARALLTDLREGWRAFRSIDWLWRGVVTMSLWNAAWAAYAVLGPVVSGEAAVWAAVSTAYGIGAVAGGLLLVRLRPRRPGLLFTVGLALGSAPALALATGVPVGLAAAVAGAGAVGFNATWQSVVQREVPRESLSRVTSYDLFGSFALGPVGFALGGLLAEPLGPSTALLLAGLAMAALSACRGRLPASAPSRWPFPRTPRPAGRPAARIGETTI